MVFNLLSFGTMLEDTKKYFANFDGTTNCCRTIALWITAALLLAFAVTKIYTLILFKKSQKYDAETARSEERRVGKECM